MATDLNRELLAGMGFEVESIGEAGPNDLIVAVRAADEQAVDHARQVLEAALAARHVVVVAEEIVDPAVVRSDPNRTLLPSEVVQAVVHEPMGAHPSYLQGYWDRDNQFYREWDQISRDHGEVLRWLDKWVYGVEDRRAYVAKIPVSRWDALRPQEALAAPVNYGAYA